MAILPTFGCGTILPGYGPYSFPEFTTNSIDAGVGIGPVGGIRIDVPQSSRPGTPIPPGGGGGEGGGGSGPAGPAGPSAPGPAGPATTPPGIAPATPITPGPTGPSPPGPFPGAPRPNIAGGYNPISPNTPNPPDGPNLYTPTLAGGYNPIYTNNNPNNGIPLSINNGIVLGQDPTMISPIEGAAALPPKVGTYNPPENSGVLPQDVVFSINNYISNGAGIGEIDLSNPNYEKAVLTQKSDLLDDDISLDVSYFTTKLVKNTSRYTEHFSNVIDLHINYLLTHIDNNTNQDWTHVSIFGLNQNALLSSLRPEVLERLRKIKNYNDTYLTDTQIYSIFANRILDNTLDDLTLNDLLLLQNVKRTKPKIKRSTNQKVNELFVLDEITASLVSLEPSRHSKELVKLLPNWKVLSSDIDKYIPIKYGDETLKYYVKDDDTFIDRETISIKDGDFYEIYRGGTTYRIYCESEKDHAYILNEYDKQRYISILGGNSNRTLTVSSLASDNIEFEYSLTSPRQNYYLLSANLSSLETVPSNAESDYLKTTSLEYELMDTSSSEGLRDADEYIRYKANNRTFIIEDDDRILDYIESTGKIKVKQTDVLLTSPKDSKHIPLLTRQIPWYIIIYPTNRSEYSIFADKSQITSYDPTGIVERSLECAPTISKTFNIDQKELFVQYENTYLNNQPNVFGEIDLQGRLTKLNPSSSRYLIGYKESGEIKPANKFTPKRKKTGFRIIKEIIEELDNNYLLGLNGIGKSVTVFDVVSRLSLAQYANFTKRENFNTLFKLIKNGLVNDVKLVSPTKNSNDNLGKYKTQLIKRKVVAEPDTFTPIKQTADSYYITPPTTSEPPSRTR